jgi:endogenous inhibitor of DNA gyrase (YacG/DUF329 family)
MNDQIIKHNCYYCRQPIENPHGFVANSKDKPLCSEKCGTNWLLAMGNKVEWAG